MASAKAQPHRGTPDTRPPQVVTQWAKLCLEQVPAQVVLAQAGAVPATPYPTLVVVVSWTAPWLGALGSRSAVAVRRAVTARSLTRCQRRAVRAARTLPLALNYNN
eukprot:22674-Chlamydomonas_euryale.AAC.1